MLATHRIFLSQPRFGPHTWWKAIVVSSLPDKSPPHFDFPFKNLSVGSLPSTTNKFLDQLLMIHAWNLPRILFLLSFITSSGVSSCHMHKLPPWLVAFLFISPAWPCFQVIVFTRQRHACTNMFQPTIAGSGSPPTAQRNTSTTEQKLFSIFGLSRQRKQATTNHFPPWGYTAVSTQASISSHSPLSATSDTAPWKAAAHPISAFLKLAWVLLLYTVGALGEMSGRVFSQLVKLSL